MKKVVKTMLPIIARAISIAARVASKAKSFAKTIKKAEDVTGVTTKKALTKSKEFAKTVKTESAKPRATRYEMSSSNKVFQRELANAGQGLPSALGKNAQQKVKIFYRATQKIWEGLPAEKRNEAILKYFDTDNLYNAYLKVMQKQTKVLSKVGRELDEVLSTEQREFYNELEPTSDGDYLPELVQMFA